MLWSKADTITIMYYCVAQHSMAVDEKRPPIRIKIEFANGSLAVGKTVEY